MSWSTEWNNCVGISKIEGFVAGSVLKIFCTMPTGIISSNELYIQEKTTYEIDY
jgi:hypothetical protein